MTRAESTPPAAPDDLSACEVLVVDDNQQNLELLVASLESLGCRLRTAMDGPEALDEVAKKAPDLILLDIMMPRMSGYQVCKKIKADPALKGIPIVMVTALNEVSDVEHAVEVGADDFISKPINRLELLTRVRAMLRLSLLQKQVQKTVGDIRKATDG
jgi:two-component system, OmpR family, alkaline phosphatase synthesis response regulator PhoP